MAVTATINSIEENVGTKRFDITVTYTDGVRSAQKVISIDPGSSIAAAQRIIVLEGKPYITQFAQEAAFATGVAGYQQYVGAVIQVT